jgi:hypothetical protein
MCLTLDLERCEEKVKTRTLTHQRVRHPSVVERCDLLSGDLTIPYSTAPEKHEGKVKTRTLREQRVDWIRAKAPFA